MLYKGILICFLCSLATSGFSQNDVSFQGGGTFGYLTSKRFNDFTNVYNNAQNPDEVKHKMTSSLPCAGYNLQGAFIIGKLYSGLGLTQMYSRSEAEFTNEAKRVLTMSHAMFGTYLGFRKKKEKTEFAIYTGFFGTNTFINTYIQYPNGDKDHVSGAINGTYHSVGFGVPLALELNFKIKNKVSWFFKGETFYSATKFTFFRAQSGPAYSGLKYGNVEMIDDFQRFTIQTGIKYTIEDIKL